MINVYIDTCSLVNLLNEDKGEFLIDNLQFWIDNNRVKLFTHEQINAEWNKHKEKKRTSFRESQETKYKHTQEVIRKENLYVPKNLKPSTEALDKLILKIDNLLTTAIEFQTSIEVKAKSSERTVYPRKAPFHNKLDSTKDAYIIFSALEYFEQKSEPFTFISDNKNDFGDPANLDRNIHPEIVRDMPNIVVDYYRDIGWAISDFRKQIDISLLLEDKSQPDIDEITEKIAIDKSKALLDQLVDYLEFMHHDIKYVPPHILTNHYPFVIDIRSDTYYSLFNIELGNDQLLELFKKMNLSNEGILPANLADVFPEVIDAENKCKTSLRYLTGDLIFSISNKRDNKAVVTRYTEGETCHCSNCEFQRFNFVKSFRQLDNDEKGALSVAYTHYHIGNYEFAANRMKLALELSKEKKLNTTSYILQYNLSKLVIFLRNHYYKNETVEQIANELSKINPDNLIIQYARPENKDLLEFIAENSFYIEAKNKIYDLHFQNLENYYESLKGTWSSNRNVWSIKNCFAEIITFLNSNYIIFDRFSEFSNLCERVFEAMFASHAIKESSGSRLDSFDDWTMQQMMLYGDADKLNRFYSRYKLKKLNYQDTQDEGDTFLQLLNNFFSGYENLRKEFVQYCEKDNRNFWTYYNRIFCNALTLISITDFKKEVRRGLSVKILHYLTNEDFIHENSLKHVSYLFTRIGKSLETETLIGFFWVMVQNKKYHGEYCVEPICDILNYRHEMVNVSDIEFVKIKDAFIEYETDGAICRIHEALIHIQTIIRNEPYKKELQTLINSHIQKEFKFDFYYNALILDVIQYDAEDFEKALKSVLASLDRKSIGYIFGQPSDRVNQVNDFINLCFKLDFNTKSDNFKALRETSPYYDWLLDMENFDYSNFKPDWIGEYVTRHYFKRIANNDKVRDALESYLKDEVNTSMEKLYYNIFIRRPWDISR
jgi:hypothetical protein